MRLRHFEIVHAVYASGSVSGAARALGISQPSVSKTLRHAEDSVGFDLFRLVRGRLVATDEAHALMREAGDVFDRLNSLQETARNLRSRGGGHIRLAVVPSLGLSVTPRAIAAFRRRHPHVSFEVQTLHHDELVRSLNERRSDLAIAYDPPAHPRMVIRPIAQGELAILFRNGEMVADGERASLGQLDGRELIGVASSGPVGDLLSAAFARLNIHCRETISVQTFYVAAALVQNGSGLAVVDEFTARAWRSHDLDFRRVDPPLEFAVCCVTLEERPLSRVAERFVRSLAAALATEADP
jgi:DNA-binding transcriptional LysR family regulator